MAIEELHNLGASATDIGRELSLHGQQVAGHIRTAINMKKLKPFAGPKPPEKPRVTELISDDPLARIENKVTLLISEVTRLRVEVERSISFENEVLLRALIRSKGWKDVEPRS